MNLSSILLPVLVQLSLTLIIFLLLGVRKTQALKAGEVDTTKTALNNSAWPVDVVKVSNNIANQFQTPILFYVLSIAFYITNTVDTLVLALAWTYVISRIAHAYIHVGSNFVPARFKIFIVSILTLIIMTIVAFIKVLH